MSDWMTDRAALHCQNYAFTSESSIRDLIEECYRRGLAERDERERSLEAALTQMRNDLTHAARIQWSDGSSGSAQLSAMIRYIDSALAAYASAGEPKTGGGEPVLR